MISIIVPVYNVENTLGRCVDSIKSQSYTDWELLLIDDGSTDKSKELCESYASNDERISAFSKENGGPGAARNYGLNRAKGEFVTFVDSDDCIERDYLQILLDHMTVNVDLVISNYGGCVCDNKQVSKWNLINTSNFNLLFEANERCYIVPWGKLYRKRILTDNDIHFIAGMGLGEDAVFLYTYMLCCDNMCLLQDNAGYRYDTESENSLSRKSFPLTVELFSYEQVRKAIDKLIVAKSLADKTAIGRLNGLKAFFIKRILNALYYSGLQRPERMKILEEIEVDLYVQANRPVSRLEKLYQWMLSKHFYYKYDLLRSGIASVKKL